MRIRISRRRRPRLWPILALGMLAGCGGSVPIPGSPGGEADLYRGEKALAQHRYLQAIEALDRFRTEHPGSERIDDAIYLLGKAHQGAGEHLLAREEFGRLLRDFPQSEHREDAQFEQAISWLSEAHGPALDPEPTEAALEEFRSYLRIYPDGAHRAEAEAAATRCLDRLAVKAYLNGRTYLQLKQGKAARIYFDKALTLAPEFSKAGETLLGLGRAAELLGETEEARSAYRRAQDYVTPERLAAAPHLREVDRAAKKALTKLGDSADGRP